MTPVSMELAAHGVGGPSDLPIPFLYGIVAGTGAWYLGLDTSANGGLGTVYVFVWGGLVPLALLAGHVWRDLSPWRTLQAGVGRITGRPEGFIAHPERLGHWPAALGLLAFVWLELASPDPGSIDLMRAWVGAYAVITVAAGLVFGPRWFDRGDPFDVYSVIVARFAAVLGSSDGDPGGVGATTARPARSARALEDLQDDLYVVLDRHDVSMVDLER